MFKSKRFWGTVVAVGAAAAAKFGLEGDPVLAQALTNALSVIYPLFVLLTKAIDQAKGK
jgi:hypothetical protein